MVTSYIGGMYSEIDYDDYKLNKTVKGRDGCHICDNLNRLHANKRITLQKPSLEFMKKLVLIVLKQIVIYIQREQN